MISVLKRPSIASTDSNYPWSTVKWGKGALVEKPKAFSSAPALSNINVQISGIDSRPQVKFIAKHPDDVTNAVTNPTGLACFRLEASYDNGAWQHSMTQTVSWLFASGEGWIDLPDRTNGKEIKIDATSVQLRMRYEWYDGLQEGHAPVNGDSKTTFSPNILIPREQVAAMLTRTVQAAKPGIVTGMGDGKFAPRNTTAAEEAAGYANATREQSLVIAMRSLETLK